MANNEQAGYVGDNFPTQRHEAGQAALQQANFRAQQEAARQGELSNKAAAKSNSGGSQGSATITARYRKGR